MFDGSDKGIKFRDVTDGTSHTIALVEADADQAVEWTKPDDWEYDAANPNSGLGHLRPGGWNAAFCDGSVRFISNDTDVEMLKAFFTRSGGEIVGGPAAPRPDAQFAPPGPAPVPQAP
jgi:prepilin-type processing-associated H-X9-DG protein